MVVKASLKVVGCSEMKNEEDKRDEKEKGQKRMGMGMVMGRIQGKDEVAGWKAKIGRGSEEGKVLAVW